MKGLLICFALLLNFNVSNASFVVEKEKASSEQTSINPNLHRTQQSLDYSKELPDNEKGQEENVTKKDEHIARKKGFFERLFLKLAKNRYEKKLGMTADGTEHFNLGGFLLGLLIPLVGVLGAYIFKANKNFIKWAWIGTATYFLVGLILFIGYLGHLQ